MSFLNMINSKYNSIFIERRPDDSALGYAVTELNIFLAGSIEQGAAEMWQNRVIDHIKTTPHRKSITVFNPRRTAWDPTWGQTEENPEFVYQVSWELNHIEKSDIIFFWFDGNTKSPVSMLELGLALKMSKTDGKQVIIYCPDEFWRAGNVRITAKRYGIRVFNKPELAINRLIASIL